MATLKQVKDELELDMYNIGNIPASKISLYLEIILMIVNFIVERKVDKRSFKWWNIPLIISVFDLFKRVIDKLKG